MARDLASEIVRAAGPDLSLRVGVMLPLDTSEAQAGWSVQVGSGPPLEHVGFINSYAPNAGDVVFVGKRASAWVVFGALTAGDVGWHVGDIVATGTSTAVPVGSTTGALVSTLLATPTFVLRPAMAYKVDVFGIGRSTVATASIQLLLSEEGGSFVDMGTFGRVALNAANGSFELSGHRYIANLGTDPISKAIRVWMSGSAGGTLTFRPLVNIPAWIQVSVAGPAVKFPQALPIV